MCFLKYRSNFQLNLGVKDFINYDSLKLIKKNNYGKIYYLMTLKEFKV